MSNPLKVYWFGYGGSSWMAERLRHTIENKLGMSLITIHEHPDANIEWSLDTVYLELAKADIIIVPANFERQPCKSNNRLTQAMAMGKPVICEPMPSYVPIVKNFDNAIILKKGSMDEWEFALDILKNDPNLRIKLSKNALKTAQNYTVDKMANKWAEVLNTYKLKTKEIDVVIPTKNNIPIIKECLKSFENSTLDETIYIIDNDTDTDNLQKLVQEMGIPYEVREI